MSDPHNPQQVDRRLQELLEQMFEERLDAEGVRELEQLVLSSPHARKRYRDYMHLHGTLFWDAATAHPARPVTRVEQFKDHLVNQPRSVWGALAIAAAILLLVGGSFWFKADGEQIVDVEQPQPGNPEIVDISPDAIESPSVKDEMVATSDGTSSPAENLVTQSNGDELTNKSVSPVVPSPTSVNNTTAVANSLPPAEAPLPLIAAIDRQLTSSWQLAEVEPSPRASDGEWLRRVHLDVIGRTPTVDVVNTFLSDRSPTKRADMVDQLVESQEFQRHFAEVWTNLLVGLRRKHANDRRALNDYLQECLVADQGWDEIVTGLVTAQGTSNDNGASGFLVAHLNNQAVPATAVTARVLLGTQIQCMQCHDHPFNDWKQEDFWEFNSFFMQVRPEWSKGMNAMNARQMSIQDRPVGGPTYYETRHGVMRVAFPQYEGKTIPEGPDVNRREKLAGLMTSPENPQLARAFINRMWNQFFGAGFTNPVDDMGPHNPPSHPQVLEQLTEAFLDSDYDIKSLVRWICQTEAYQLSSRMTESNRKDDPAYGSTPLFSRVYLKPMSAEQMFDSLVVATQVPSEAVPNREKWLQQFFYDYQNDENNEDTTFGMLPQSLAMMNGQFMSELVDGKPGSIVDQVIESSWPLPERIRFLCRATLSRDPSPQELASMRWALLNATRQHQRGQTGQVDEAYQDLLWALLNSNEFASVP
ncbi:DUF1549 and DUF1553 domain-containing protein [Calycomorphotria hydatis]|uniref:DUF1549 domain-containing protein n=1 Tax=Calycomorphotria hydatis TaxID=2528027 RepID=A0A517T6L5_9PLAN|nr:DUF1549 and DUF1553 domain-containing protein [Calycomorphotria hydatis]QDT64016.1 hypothetical protein V22_12460 [Calycomorphotria hydatis]